jgi:hypothetical protein
MNATDQRRRHLGQYNFEGGGFVEIVVTGNVNTEEALDMVSVLVDLKRSEITKIKAAGDQ